jgi:hypothetical protein
MPLTRRPSPLDEQEKRKRNLLIIGGILILLVVATVFEVGIRAPQIPFASNLIVFFLFNLNLIVFLLLLVLLFRNLVKLSFERRHKIIGSRFKAKLVLTFLALSLVPRAGSSRRSSGRSTRPWRWPRPTTRASNPPRCGTGATWRG